MLSWINMLRAIAKDFSRATREVSVTESCFIRQGLHFVCAFLGCLYAGVLAVSLPRLTLANEA